MEFLFIYLFIFQILIAHGAPLFIVNKSFETVCDLAEKNRHDDIAQYLETKMLFYVRASVLLHFSSFFC